MSYNFSREFNHVANITCDLRKFMFWDLGIHIGTFLSNWLAISLRIIEILDTACNSENLILILLFAKKKIDCQKITGWKYTTLWRFIIIFFYSIISLFLLFPFFLYQTIKKIDKWIQLFPLICRTNNWVSCLISSLYLHVQPIPPITRTRARLINILTVTSYEWHLYFLPRIWMMT